MAMKRREFVKALGLAAVGTQFGCASAGASNAVGERRLRKVGIQLYTLRDDARRDLEGTLVNIAKAGYKEVELLSSMNNFGMPPAQLRAILDRNGLVAPSTHVETGIFENLEPQIEAAKILGHQYLIVASLPDADKLGLDDYRRWADRFNEAGARALRSNIRIGFHDEAWDFRNMNGTTPYDVFVQRADPAIVALQLDTGNAAVGGKDPLEYMQKYGPRYQLFHIKDAPSIPAEHDVELGKGVVNFRRLLAMIDNVDQKHLYVEQESYPGAPIESVRRDYEYITKLEF
ncbi:MAG TPA: sugar phosphate isomerase/epimerase [Gemmatimonadaceae bacterium]|nr:sugar phosphate isomerase/epimerase [Gemmatimonadaceae bacterium]